MSTAVASYDEYGGTRLQ